MRRTINRCCPVTACPTHPAAADAHIKDEGSDAKWNSAFSVESFLLGVALLSGVLRSPTLFFSLLGFLHLSLIHLSPRCVLFAHVSDITPPSPTTLTHLLLVYPTPVPQWRRSSGEEETPRAASHLTDGSQITPSLPLRSSSGQCLTMTRCSCDTSHLSAC